MDFRVDPARPGGHIHAMNERPIAVIGGGPGGSTTAILLARLGLPVRLLEKKSLPRFHIGESLLPYNRALFEELGVLEALNQSGFPVKRGVQFHLGNGARALKLAFRDGRFTRENLAFQVERSRFDELLLQKARSEGAEVFENCAASGVQETESGVAVQFRTPEGESKSFEALYAVDASGQSNLTGNIHGTRVAHPKLRKISVYGHFTGVALDSGDQAGDTVIVRGPDGWFWIIPIGRDRVSVGVVADQSAYRNSGRSPADYFAASVRSSAVMTERMRYAQPVEPMRTASDFSYHNRALASGRILRVGDAAGFIDPIFSSGVYLAMRSGKAAAEALEAAILKGQKVRPAWRRYEKSMFRAFHFYREMVEHFYTPHFMEVFLQPRPLFAIPDAVNAALAGEVDRLWRLRWRMRLFFWIVKLQSKRPLLPRLKLD